MNRKIIYVTGTRADYGLMRVLLKTLDHSKEFDLSICVTGMHLSTLYGDTVKEIENDKFKICGLIPVDLVNTSHASMAKSLGHEIIGMTELFEREKPDLVLLLGDRGEMLAGAISAVHLNIPIVHLHGGERSGTIDEMIRHCISKLAHYHFVATEASKVRLIKMGEKEDSVFIVGAPGLDEFKNHIPTKELLNHRYGFSQDKKIALLIFHPVVQESDELQTQLQNAIDAALEANLHIICLEPNSDAGGGSIRDGLEQYSNHPDIRIVKHMHRPTFIDCLMQCDLMLGNSSSGIIEAATFNLRVVNIGSRQNLRERSDNVIDVDTSFDSIKAGINKALQEEDGQYVNCYGDGNSSERCYELLKTISLDKKILSKTNAY